MKELVLKLDPRTARRLMAHGSVIKTDGSMTLTISADDVSVSRPTRDVIWVKASADDPNFVRVVFLEPHPIHKRLTGDEYVYSVGELELEIGDLVDCCTRFKTHNLARVVGFGKRGYHGNPQPVLARLGVVEEQAA